MWMVDPKIMCTRHLLGEHHEIHMFAGSMRRQTGMSGYIDNNLLEPRSIKKRHDVLVAEMARRGYGHDSELEQPDVSYLPIDEQRAKIDISAAEKEIRRRCELCPTEDETFKDCPKCWKYKEGVYHGNCPT